MNERGWNLSALFRNPYGGGTMYTKRPAANRIAARAAWDHFAETGEIEWMILLDGYWGCQRPNGGPLVDAEAIHFRRKW